MLRKFGFVCLSWLFSLSLSAEILVDTTVINPPSAVNIGPTLSLSEIEYENEDGNTFTVDRKVLGLGLVYRFDSSANLLLQMGYTFETEFEDSNFDDGTGYMAGIGVNFAFYRSRKVSFVGYGLLDYVKDRYEIGRHNIDMDIMDFHLGSTVLFKLGPVAGLFVGVDLVPYSEGSLDYYNRELEIERDDSFNVRFGMQFALPNAYVTPEVVLNGEQTFSLKATFAL